MAAGQPAETFWEQSVATWRAILDGCRTKADREMEAATFAAWQTARMTHYGEKKLRPLGDFLKELKGGPRAQTPEQMIAVLKAIIPGAAN